MFLDIKIDREAVARYGINIGDVQDLIETAVGGQNLGVVIAGRERYPIRVRYQREWRDNLEALKNLLVPVNVMGSAPEMTGGGAPTAEGMSSNESSMNSSNGENRPSPFTLRSSVSSRSYIPLSQLAKIEIVPGPPMISSENAQLRSIVFLNVRGRDMGSFVEEAKKVLEKELKLPQGYTVQWSGQWENQLRAKKRLEIMMPIVLLIIFVMLYFTTKDFTEAFVVMLSVPFALIGGVYLIYILGYNFSVAVWIGFIALYGVAVQTGVVMVVYLHEALDKRLRAHEQGKRGPIVMEDVTDATIEGSVLRLRPKVMTVSTALIGLLPIMWSTGAGADVMQPIAAPMIGGLITSTLHVLIVTPVLFSYMKEHALKKGTLKVSKMASWMKEG
ncbi:MAG: efflux RND transporter permease subunit [bacterium]